MLGNVVFTDKDGYKYAWVFQSFSVSTTTDVRQAPPGKTNLTPNYQFRGQFQNLTPGRELNVGVLGTPYPYLAFPAGSAMCTTPLSYTNSIGMTKEFTLTTFNGSCTLGLNAVTVPSLPGPDQSVPFVNASDPKGLSTGATSTMWAYQIDEALAPQIEGEIAAAALVIVGLDGLGAVVATDPVVCEATLTQPSGEGRLVADVVYTGGSAICG